MRLSSDDERLLKLVPDLMHIHLIVVLWEDVEKIWPYMCCHLQTTHFHPYTSRRTFWRLPLILIWPDGIVYIRLIMYDERCWLILNMTRVSSGVGANDNQLIFSPPLSLSLSLLYNFRVRNEKSRFNFENFYSHFLFITICW